MRINFKYTCDTKRKITWVTDGEEKRKKYQQYAASRQKQKQREIYWKLNYFCFFYCYWSHKRFITGKCQHGIHSYSEIAGWASEISTFIYLVKWKIRSLLRKMLKEWNKTYSGKYDQGRRSYFLSQIIMNKSDSNQFETWFYFFFAMLLWQRKDFNKCGQRFMIKFPWKKALESAPSF